MTIREFKMPDVGEGLTEAEILKWYVQPGDTVTDGQVVCEVETAKAAVELPIPFDGVVHALLFEEGVTVDVGQVIISVRTGPADEAPAEAAAAAPAAAAPAAPAAAAAEPEAPAARQPVLVGYGVSTASTKRRPRKAPQPAVAAQNGTGVAHAAAAPAAPAPAAPAAPATPAVVPAQGGAGKALAKPPVRKLAKDLGIDLAAVVPTGDGGVVTREDVHAAAAAAITPQTVAPAVPVSPAVPAAAQAAPAAPVQVVPAEVSGSARETRIPVKGVRKVTAQAMVGSAFTAPHVTEFITFDVTRTMKLVQELKDDPDLAGLRINPLLLIAKAVLVAIRRNPDVNASWDEAAQEIVLKHYVNLGIAAATPRGLIVPNIKDAHAKTLGELSQALSGLVATAREGKTSPADMQQGTITITNVGVFGVDTGTPILNPGESAILAVGAIKLQPWVHKGKVKARHVTTLALSFDHRLIDGELGSRFLADIAAVLEHPRRLITWS
ncbi:MULTISPECIES: dihydrolipoamide acetyltransferase family protein [unclassified Streptomyces]|uniref:dihydrolipoamide acetyltransferase family protein n=1 Tax=unclassified Streptomyces TaxID=2593676 RepID=UPI00202DD815|nr:MULTISPECIES: dihydrolipoamide acetyltransferase family protein [unclassified Streptomyces]MCM1965672.1 2-oxo acid dehydrogenase subunit E2 [Streptomyces sp. G1]MCX5123892.1 2-oxo acid dehydrogenase subunit E2 [Streptomyces sp. NBC_00347]MCX5297137.1 2-oxo acid dehydrogenase subunit E2 [Streptomyces sp. NBC_00193]